MLNVPKSNVIDVCRKFSDTESVENKPRSGRLKKIKPQDYQQLERIVKTNRRSLLSDIITKLNEGRSDPVSKRTIQYNLHKHNYRRSVVKKKKTEQNKFEVMLWGASVGSAWELWRPSKGI